MNERKHRVFQLNVVFVMVLCGVSMAVEHNMDRSINEIKEDVTHLPDVAKDDKERGPFIGTNMDNSITTANSEQHNGDIPTTSPSPIEDLDKRQETDSRRQEDQMRSTHKPPIPLDPTDKYLLDGILEIVDAKFDTLHKRLMTLERGMNNLQYYNARSFRTVNTHLHAVDTIMHTLHTDVSEVKQQHVQLDKKIADIKHDVGDLASTNSGIFNAMEQHSFYYSDIQTKLDELQRSVEQTNDNFKDIKNDTDDIKATLMEAKKFQGEMLVNSETSVILATEVIQTAYNVLNDTRAIKEKTREIKHQSFYANKIIEGVARNISVITKDSEEMKNTLTLVLANVTNKSNDSPKDTQSNNKKVDTFETFNHIANGGDDDKLQMTCAKMFELIDDRLRNLNVSVSGNQQRLAPGHEGGANVNTDIFRNESRKLLRGLEQVNRNVFQSVTLYKHTGNLIERLLSDTETIAYDQITLREDLVAYLLNGTFELFNRSLPEFVTFEAKEKSNATPPQHFDAKCLPTEPFLQELSMLTRNGSHLVELLTELAVASSSTINLAIEKLDNEIAKLAHIRENVTIEAGKSSAKNKTKVVDMHQLSEMHNRTDLIYVFAEAIASNTRWIPHLYHRVIYVENLVNKSLDIVNKIDSRAEETLLKQTSHMAGMFKPIHSATSNERKQEQHTLPDKKPLTTAMPTAAVTTSLDQVASSQDVLRSGKRHDTKRKQLTDSDVNEMMEFVYKTNKKVDRIIPALTHLLGEPEPYISLVDGSTDREGRVEIYHKGEWGTIPREISHIEASYICRKLGYLGGVSAGSGHFGRGSGAFWDLNVTCLRTRWCNSVGHVENPSTYSHEMDVGIICDHMVRLTKSSDEDEPEVSRQSGSLEIYHQNNWLPVCFENWGREETEVVCKQLGFVEGAAQSEKDETLDDSYSMTNVTCTGSENRLDACAFDGFTLNGCPSSEYVSVICS
ncbi:hypothetical protein DPMN_063562 [Dreissena polymorpha]|uniref:SRCR domain-containing protein n=2 Tax=Dreissena polymorpha TaxID=45954 RepID=A0A9D4CBZ2_DREPO|nr:hypothetical protein DPMN_063562 [Dreissena polymorpha]